jgi:hypothetical protein
MVTDTAAILLMINDRSEICFHLIGFMPDNLQTGLFGVIPQGLRSLPVFHEGMNIGIKEVSRNIRLPATKHPERIDRAGRTTDVK